MNVKSIVVEQIDWEGTSKSITIEPNNRNQLWIAFPTDYEEARNSPFYFQRKVHENEFNDGFAQSQARKISKENFFKLNNQYTYKTIWRDIPTESMMVSYYALYLPENAVPIKINLYDPYNKGKQYKRTIFKDNEKPRYIIYLQCASKFGKFSFEGECIFEKNESGFEQSSYNDEFQQGFYAQPEEWQYLLNDQSRGDAQHFFAESITYVQNNNHTNIMKKNNPWISGLFYLFAATILIAGLSIISNLINWKVLPVIIVGGILLIGIIGALQLKNDDKLTDSSFLKLIIETYKKLPLINLFSNEKSKK